MKSPRRIPAAIAAAAALAVLVAAAPAQDKPKLGADIEKALASIRGEDAYGWVKTLASPEFAGRLTGSEGYAAAARWAAAKFKQWGLKPILPPGGYLQPYVSPYTVVQKAEMTYLPPGDKPAVKLELNKDFLPLLFTDSGRAEAGLVFAGWAVSAPDLGYDDYAGLDVKGKFVLCFRGQPFPGDTRFQMHDEHRTRMKAALAKGALGVIYIYPEPISNPNGDWLQGFTPAIVSEKAADLILQERGLDSARLKRDLQTYDKPLSFALQGRLRYAVESRHVPDAMGYNIGAYIEGSDPALRKDVIVVGGHFDHNGTHAGLMFPGANDNASGSATVLAIAQAYARLASPPKRSVAFLLFGGEEMGLQGSTFFAGHLPVPFARVDGMFNFDMTGEGDGAGGAYAAAFPDLEKHLRAADRYVGILRGLGEMKGAVGVRGSDFAPFYEKGAATVAIGSNGPHLAYHATGDTIYRINPDIMADIAKLAFLASRSWADR